MYTFDMYDTTTGEVYYSIICAKLSINNNYVEFFDSNGDRIGFCHMMDAFAYNISRI